MARRKEFRRQSKDQLAGAVRKHFNGLGVQENDIIVDFLHKVRTQAIVKPTGAKRPELTLAEQS
jgi:histone deacetylase complex subunit SAP30